MHWTSFVAVLGLRYACTTPTPLERDEDSTFIVERPKAFAPPTELKVSNNVMDLKRTGGKSPSSRELINRPGGKMDALDQVGGGSTYAVDVTLSGETFSLIFDTGSSDLWVARQDLQCLNARGAQVPTAVCDFGPLFKGTFQGGEVEDQHFNISYGDGEYLTGTLGYEPVSVASVKVPRQEVALVDEGYWIGDGVSSGIIGFAYPSLTSAYEGDDPDKDNPKTNSVHYPNFIRNAIKQEKIKPMFSVALERGPGRGGQVALGGLPTMDFDHNFTSTPLEIVQFSKRHPIGAKKLTYYTITVDGVVIDGQMASTEFNGVVDTGTTLAYVSPLLAQTINKAFDPPSLLVNGLWENYCDAKPPNLSIRIAGTNFPISAAELLLPKPFGFDPATGGCVCGFQAGAEPYILGDTFLKNVVSVFDIGDAEMRFASHVNY